MRSCAIAEDWLDNSYHRVIEADVERDSELITSRPPCGPKKKSVVITGDVGIKCCRRIVGKYVKIL